MLRALGNSLVGLAVAPALGPGQLIIFLSFPLCALGQSNRDRDQSCIKIVSAVAVGTFVAITLFSIFLQEVSRKRGQLLSGPACPDEWIGYQGKCYYFSVEKGNWTSGQDFCSLQAATLLTFYSSQEKDFVMRYKGKTPFWIGLWRDPGQPWKWTNGENSMLEVIGDGGDCAFLNSEATATSSWCRTKLPWICSKPDVFKSLKAG